MRLPADLRNMIYKEALVIPKPGIIHLDFDKGSPRWGGKPTVIFNGGWEDRRADVNPACHLFSTCYTIYAEAAIFYYGLNRFSLFNLDLLDIWLRSMRPEFRRLIGRIAVYYAGQAPKKALKSLAECVGLKELLLHTSCPMVKHLLKLRGLKKVTLDTAFLETQPDFILEGRKETLVKMLEVLKKPHKPGTLTKQEKKDYPNRRSRRTVFGKTNVTTRTEKKFVAQQWILT